MISTYQWGNANKEPLEIAVDVASGSYKGESWFTRHMIARDYWLYVLNNTGPFPWMTDGEASKWLKQFEVCE